MLIASAVLVLVMLPPMVRAVVLVLVLARTVLDSWSCCGLVVMLVGVPFGLPPLLLMVLVVLPPFLVVLVHVAHCWYCWW